MTSILFCSICHDYWKCDAILQCPWLSLHDEANCSQQCSSPSYPIPCDCNKEGNMTSEGRKFSDYVCYTESRKFLLFFIFVNVTIAVKLSKLDYVSKDCLIVT